MPAKSKAQFRAMQAAAHGNSTLGISAKVGKEYVAGQSPQGLPERKKKNVKGSNDTMHSGPARPNRQPPANPKVTNQTPHQKESGYNLRGAAHSSHMRKKVKDGLAAAFPKSEADCSY